MRIKKNKIRKRLFASQGCLPWGKASIVSLVWASILPLALAMTTACTFDSSDNGDFDGYWHLERVDTLATQGMLDLSQKRIFWGVQYHLMQCKDVDKEANDGFYFRFTQTADSIIVHNPYKNNWHQDYGDDGGDLPVTQLNDTIRSYGINNLQEPFFKEKLKGDKMILRSKMLRLYFTKF